MAQDRTPDPALQPCLGKNGGHLPLDAPGSVLSHPSYWVGVAGYPDLQVLFLPAVQGVPCLGRYIQQRGAGYDVLDIPHIGYASIHFTDPQLVSFPALIAAHRDATDRVRILTHELDKRPIADQRRIRAGWRAAFRDLAKLRGRHPVDIADHVAQLRSNYERQKPICAQLQHHPTRHPIHKECVPDGDTLEASRERLRDKGLSWTKLKTVWGLVPGSGLFGTSEGSG